MNPATFLRFSVCVFLAAGSSVQSATYHVDSTAGNDSADGLTPATAWQSLAKANSIAYQPGDSLLLRAGATWTGQLQPQGSGTPAGRITIGRYGDGPKPSIHGGGIAGGAVTLDGVQYWTIRDLELTNNGSSAPKKQGILVRNNCVGTLSGIEVRDCDIHDVTGVMTGYTDGKESGGIVFKITSSNLAVPSKWTDIVIEGNTIRRVAREGILMQSLWINKPQDPNSNWDGAGPYVASENVRIASNTLDDIGGDGIVPWCVKNGLIEYNIVRRSNNNTLGQGHAALWPYFCEDIVMQFNEVSETLTKFDGMAFDFDNSDQRCIYQYNYSHDNEGGFLNMTCDGNGNGNIARYNISENDGCIPGSRVFLVHGNGNHTYRIYNNTIYVSNGNPRLFEQGADSSGSDIKFRNNIFINRGTGPYSVPGGCVFENNLYFGNGNIGADATKILADPMLVLPGSGGSGLGSVDGYKLLAGSPAFGSGRIITANGGRDYWGSPVPPDTASNIGAYNGPAVPQIVTGSGVWTQAAGGSWTSPANWQNGTMAIGSNSIATFQLSPAVTVDQPIDDLPLGGFVFGNADHTVTGGSFLLSVSAGSPVAEVGSGSATIASRLGGTGGFRKAGGGTLTLRNVNTYSGGTVVEAGTLVLRSTGPEQSAVRGSLTINSGGTVRITGPDYTGLGRIDGATVGTLNVNGGTVENTIASFITGATVNLTGSRMSGGAFHLISSSLNSKASVVTSTVSSNLTVRKDYGSSDLTADVEDGGASPDLRISGNIAEVSATAFIKTGTGTLELTGSSTHSGGTTVRAGKLSILGTGKIHAGAGWAARVVTVNSSAVLEIDRWGGDGSLGQSDYASGNLVLNGGTLRYTGSETATPAAVDGNTGRAFSLGTHGGTLESASPMGRVFAMTQYNATPGTYALPAFNSTLTLAGTGDGYIGKSISGSGGITKSGSGTWTLAVANSYTGPTAVNAGTLRLGNGTGTTNLANTAAVIVASGATLHLNFPGSDSVNSLSYGGIARRPGIYSAANSPFITGNGSLNVLTGPANDLAGWTAYHALGGGLSGDDDNDGVVNFAEYAFGLDPNDAASSQTVPGIPTPATGVLRYTRRQASLTGLTFTIWTSADLKNWTEDTGITQTVAPLVGSDNETAEVTLSGALLNSNQRFIRIQAQ